MDIIINGDNPNIMEIIDYVRDYYVRHNDYDIQFKWSSHNGQIGQLTAVTLQLFTDELREDGNLRYLLLEPSVT